MEIDSVGIIFACIIGLIFIGIIFKISILKILRLITNSLLGGVLIFFINQVGVRFGLHIGLNLITSVFVGVFGVPGAVLLLVLNLF